LYFDDSRGMLYFVILLNQAVTVSFSILFPEIVICLQYSQDYLDAFEKLVHLGLKNQLEREIIHVIVYCCLQEKKFNPYYAYLSSKFCQLDRRFLVSV
jgi:hypothetical protein